MTDDTRRHWHGSPGDRHEHHNVWVQGGPKSQTSRAAWALTPEMIANMQQRRGSDASTGSAGSGAANANANANNGAANAAPTLPSVAERRRSSAGSGTGLFSNLQSQKRESNNPEMETRRASWNEQQQKGGVFSKFWNEYTRGK